MLLGGRIVWVVVVELELGGLDAVMRLCMRSINLA